MKKLFFSLILFSCLTLVKAQQNTPKVEEGQMKQYFFVMLKKGPIQNQDKSITETLQAGHMAHMQKMYEDGKLNMAGPFADNGDWRGIWIFNTETIEEAKKLAEQDPMIKAGHLVYEIHPWWSQKGVKLN